MVGFNLPDTRRGRLYRYAPLVLWIGTIFFLSSGSGSSSQTSSLVLPLLEFLFPSASAETLTIYHSHVRKLAHFFVYAVLAFWSWRALKDSSNQTLRKFRYVFSLAIVLFVASLDEINQSFNAARTSSIYDVAIDFAGGLTVILIVYFAEKSRRFNGEKW